MENLSYTELVDFANHFKTCFVITEDDVKNYFALERAVPGIHKTHKIEKIKQTGGFSFGSTNSGFGSSVHANSGLDGGLHFENHKESVNQKPIYFQLPHTANNIPKN